MMGTLKDAVHNLVVPIKVGSQMGLSIVANANR